MGGLPLPRDAACPVVSGLPARRRCPVGLGLGKGRRQFLLPQDSWLSPQRQGPEVLDHGALNRQQNASTGEACATLGELGPAASEAEDCQTPREDGTALGLGPARRQTHLSHINLCTPQGPFHRLAHQLRDGKRKPARPSRARAHPLVRGRPSSELRLHTAPR